MTDNVESKVAQTILQLPTEIKVGEKTYKVAPPTVATMILVSEQIAKLPKVKFDDQRLVEDVLRNAKDCRALGDIAAILILGAKGLKERVTEECEVPKIRFFGLSTKMTKVCISVEHDRQAELAKAILEEYNAAELYNIIIQCLQTLHMADFFGLTTFLCEISMTKPTKVE